MRLVTACPEMKIDGAEFYKNNVLLYLTHEAELFI